MDRKFEQRICIIFCYKIGKSASETLDLLKLAFGNENVNKPTTFRWFSRFKNGIESVKDEKRVGRPILHRNPEKEETGISKSLVGSIIKEDLQLKKTPSKFVPKMLTIQQKENRVDVAKKMLEMVEENPNWKGKVITGDETWVHGYDPEKNANPWSGKEKMNQERRNPDFAKVKCGVPKIGLSIHDNAPPHTATSVLTYLTKHGIQILHQPPYSLDLAPNDFFLFPKLKMALKGRRFDTRESIIANSKKVLKNIPKDAFSKCFKSWEKRWKLCIDAGGSSEMTVPHEDEKFSELKILTQVKQVTECVPGWTPGKSHFLTSHCCSLNPRDLLQLSTSTTKTCSIFPGLCQLFIETNDHFRFQETLKPLPVWRSFRRSHVLYLLVVGLLRGLLLATFPYSTHLVYLSTVHDMLTGLSVYLGIMRCLREAVRLKRPERWQNNDWILHVGNARPHTAHVVLQFLAKHSTIQIPHPPYSPDLAPNDFFFYPKLKINLKGRKFDNVDMIQAESKAP
ncbi:hypothetical protein LAZ67_17001512 [Cordylochernes scorpioides]|uniref:Mos1 transposase HTH domain-containing protein n=1 Tax=Cordylochernes scorpioides TaxID=51811 RepID=A0ABY6LDS4_9ARAC|nr:hypothetical protein LAZ67_17001512 [Cordylochernes scorpioides]